jgi:hypothetical protein
VCVCALYVRVHALSLCLSAMFFARGQVRNIRADRDDLHWCARHRLQLGISKTTTKLVMGFVPSTFAEVCLLHGGALQGAFLDLLLRAWEDMALPVARAVLGDNQDGRWDVGCANPRRGRGSFIYIEYQLVRCIREVIYPSSGQKSAASGKISLSLCRQTFLLLSPQRHMSRPRGRA